VVLKADEVVGKGFEFTGRIVTTSRKRVKEDKVNRLHLSLFLPRMKIYLKCVQFLLGFAFSFRGFRLPLIEIPTELGVFTGCGAEIPSNQIR